MDASFGFCKSDPNVPISHLDYTYIGKCSNQSELEKLLKILRSGGEGTYPDLISFTEKRLHAISPESKLLQKTNPVLSMKDLEKNEGNQMLDDLQAWSEHISGIDKSINQRSEDVETNYPPIRSDASKQCTKHENYLNSPEGKDMQKNSKRVAPRSYTEWDKIDADKEAEKVDLKDNSSGKTIITNRSVPIPTDVDATKDISHEERAIREKDKGNEAFRAGDIDEAIVYYNRSISLHESATTYNNRAMAFIKMEKFEDAIKDCDFVLRREPDNIKAFLRRGIAMKSLNRYENAKQDFENVLKLAPDNKRAKTLLAEVVAKIAETITKNDSVTRKGKKLNIEEIGDELPTKKFDSKKGKRLLIQEVDTSEKYEKTSKNSDVIRDISELQSVKAEDRIDLGNLVNHDSNNPEDSSGLDGVANNLVRKCRPVVTANNSSRKCSDENDEQISPVEKESFDDHSLKPAAEHSNLSTSSQTDNGKQSETVSTEQRELEKIQNISSALNMEVPIPDNVLKLKDSANLFYKQGRYAEAINLYTDSITYLKSEHGNYISSIAVLLSNRAICKLKIGDCKGCIDDASESLKLAPSVKALLRRAGAYETLEKYRNAYVDYQSALRIDPNATSAWDASSRLVKILKDQDGLQWRDKLPKAESMQWMNPKQTVSAPVSVGKKHESEDEAVNAFTDTSEGSKKDEKMVETKEEAFRRTKDLGNQFVHEKKYEDAAKCYGQCIALMPEEVASYTNRALCYLKLDQSNKAEADCTKALILQPDNIKALFRRATARKNGARFEDALEDLNKLLKLDPKNAAAKKELESVKKFLSEDLKRKQEQRSAELKSSTSKKKIQEIKVNEHSQGNGTIKQDDERNSDGSVIQQKKKGRKLKVVEVDDYDDMSKEGGEIKEENDIGKNPLSSSQDNRTGEGIDDGPISENQMDDAATENPVPVEVLNLKEEGNLLVKQGRYATAIEQYTKAIEMMHTDSQHHIPTLAALLSNRAMCKLKIGDCKGCIDDASESLKLVPSVKALLRRAGAYETLEKYRQAYVDNQTALRMDSSVTSAWQSSTRLIKVLMDLDGPKWREKLPTPEINFQRKSQNDGSSLLLNKNINVGSSSNNAKLGLDGNIAEKTVIDTEEQASQTDVEQKVNSKEAKKAETRKERFIRIKNIGNKYVQEEKYLDAINYYSQCIDLVPEEVASYTNRALCYLKLNKLKKAETDCTKALALQPNHVKALFRRAMARKANGRYKDALQDLMNLFKVDPNNQGAKKEYEEIKDLYREELMNSQVTAKDSKKTTETSSQKSSKGQRAKIEEITDDVSMTKDNQQTSPRRNRNQSNKMFATKDSLHKPSQKLQMKKASGFEFLQSWNELKGKGLKEYAELLTQIEPSQLPKVISNKIDGDMILTMVSCVQEFFMHKDKLLHGFNILRNISRADRFNMAIMFLSTKDLSKLKKVIEELETKLKDSAVNVTVKEISELKRAYKVTK